MDLEELDDAAWLVSDPWEREIRELLDEMDAGIDTIVVEGPRDTAALRGGGVTSPIAECARCQNLHRFTDRLDDDQIAILTDFDEHGRHLNGRLRELLPDRHVESRWRRDLGLLLTQRGRYDIESLNNVFGNNMRGI